MTAVGRASSASRRRAALDPSSWLIPPRIDADLLVQAAPAHRGPVAAASGGGDRPGAAVDVQDPAVSEVDQVVDGQAHPLVVRGADDVDGRVLGLPADRDDREPSGEHGDGAVGRQEDRRLAAEVQQRLHRLPLVPARGQRGEDELVVGLLGRDVQPVEQLQVEPAGHAEDHADQPGLAAGQQACAGVGAVADLSRGLQHPLAGLRGRAGPGPAHDQRHQRAGHPRAGRDVLQSRPLARARPVCPRRHLFLPSLREYVRTSS